MKICGFFDMPETIKFATHVDAFLEFLLDEGSIPSRFNICRQETRKIQGIRANAIYIQILECIHQTMFLCVILTLEKHNLAIQLPNNSIKLNFKPKGPGNINIPFYLEKRLNICCVCGIDKNITRHHVVPKHFGRIFRKYTDIFDKYFTNNSHDSVCLCIDCHAKYEELSNIFKRSLLIENGLNPDHLSEVNYKLYSIAALKNLRLYSDVMPKERKDILNNAVQEVFGKKYTEVTAEEENKVNVLLKSSKLIPYEQYVKYLVEKDKIHEFMIKWRQHFLDTMKPKFLSKLWRVDYNNERVQQIFENS